MVVPLKKFGFQKKNGIKPNFKKIVNIKPNQIKYILYNHKLELSFKYNTTYSTKKKSKVCR